MHFGFYFSSSAPSPSPIITPTHVYPSLFSPPPLPFPSFSPYLLSLQSLSFTYLGSLQLFSIYVYSPFPLPSPSPSHLLPPPSPPSPLSISPFCPSLSNIWDFTPLSLFYPLIVGRTISSTQQHHCPTIPPPQPTPPAPQSQLITNAYSYDRSAGNYLSLSPPPLILFCLSYL